MEGWPDNEQLLLAAAQAYASFASAFVGAEDAAFRDPLLLRAKTYALQALEQRGISAPLTSPFGDFERLGRSNEQSRPPLPLLVRLLLGQLDRRPC